MDDNQRRMPNIAETTPRGSPSQRLLLPGQLAGGSGGKLALLGNGNAARGGTTHARSYSLAPSSIASSSRKLSSSATTQNGTQLENTFQLEPRAECHFNASRVEKMLHSLMDAMLDGVEYDPDTAQELSRTLAEDAKTRVKLLKLDRHKIVVHVILGSMRGQGMRTVSRSVWNHEFDNYASACYQSRTMFAVAMVHATYFE